MDTSKIAALANLTLTTGEAKLFQSQFEDTLKTIAVINELDTNNTTATSQVTGQTNVTRPDDIDLSRILPAPTQNNGYYSVPAIFDAQ